LGTHFHPRNKALEERSGASDSAFFLKKAEIIVRNLARIIHESAAPTVDKVVLPGILGP
jgi:hypothetical protein